MPSSIGTLALSVIIAASPTVRTPFTAAAIIQNEMQSTLGKAIALWRSGRNISFHMATDLREQGYDVAALAKAHRP
ncbi:hypothetical protein DEM27_12460 [Metarhizobium album]|uniref:Uncharacterized protein n=1 Tax=Metarhizobium album TaxID=2182425 RepID=A0A2U2DSH5_9HYPH|nr:hypothetical protein [Rhizobium album]PWE56232.1 hypothetical protein DEM27_12460 [Rhizobium album]